MPLMVWLRIHVLMLRVRPALASCCLRVAAAADAARQSLQCAVVTCALGSAARPASIQTYRYAAGEATHRSVVAEDLAFGPFLRSLGACSETCGSGVGASSTRRGGTSTFVSIGSKQPHQPGTVPAVPAGWRRLCRYRRGTSSTGLRSRYIEPFCPKHDIDVGA